MSTPNEIALAEALEVANQEYLSELQRRHRAEAAVDRAKYCVLLMKLLCQQHLDADKWPVFVLSMSTELRRMAASMADEIDQYSKARELL